MATPFSLGYAGKVLRVDLTKEEISQETFDEKTLRQYLGGSGLGAMILYKEVPPGVAWSDPDNRLILASGPLGGTGVPGSGTFSAVGKGALTNGATTTQANGFLGAFMRFSGFDGIILQGAAKRPVFLHVHDGTAELKDAHHLKGKDTAETERLIKEGLGFKEQMMSVFGIGPAGENLVRYAAIVGDRGHVAAHNGLGAVMGSKRLKAIAVSRGKHRVQLKDEPAFSDVARRMRRRLQEDPRFDTSGVKDWGTLDVYKRISSAGALLQKNYTTNVYKQDDYARFCGEYIRKHYDPQLHACWACPMRHCHTYRIPDGPHAGEIVEEPEYEGLASWSSQIGQTDLTEAIMLSELVDRLGMDTNESSWVIGLAMECFEKGVLTRADTDGIDMSWGNTGAVDQMLRKIANREGFGDALAEGAMRAARTIGGPAPEFAIHTMKGNTPRNHDHRLNWREMFDTCVSSTGTLESAWHIARPYYEDIGLKPIFDPQSPMEVSTYVARAKGVLLFEDSLGTCSFCTQSGVKNLSEAVGAATGWDFAVEEALKVGLRVANLLRVFNLRHGITPDLDRPSPRYGSTPVDGSSEGTGVGPVWGDMLRNYYDLMGWDRDTGIPLPRTLESLGLAEMIKDLP